MVCFQCLLNELLLYHLYRKTRPQKFPLTSDQYQKPLFSLKFLKVLFIISSLTIFKIKLTQISLALGQIIAPHIVCVIRDTVFKHLELLELDSSYVEAVSADISKAFDNLDHQALGVRDFVLRMVASFLSGREQCVVLPNGDLSGFT